MKHARLQRHVASGGELLGGRTSSLWLRLVFAYWVVQGRQCTGYDWFIIGGSPGRRGGITGCGIYECLYICHRRRCGWLLDQSADWWTSQTGEFAGERHSTPTPAQDSTAALLAAIATVVADVPGNHAIGLAFPSVIVDGTVRTAAHLNKAWIGQPLAQLASAHLRRPVVAINDADAAGLAELHYGAARDVPGTVLLLTLGTGIGSALFIGGRLVPNTEFGHLASEAAAKPNCAPRDASRWRKT